jgi:hypothetical protein
MRKCSKYPIETPVPYHPHEREKKKKKKEGGLSFLGLYSQRENSPIITPHYLLLEPYKLKTSN